MGAETSHRHLDSPFDKFPTDMKLSIFAMLPYHDVINCMLLNKKYYHLLISNFYLMRKIPIEYLDFYSGSANHKKCVISLPYNRVKIRKNRAYADEYSSANKHLFRYFDTKRDFRRFLLKLFIDLPGIWHLKTCLNYLFSVHSIAISSIERGAEQYLDFLLSQANPQSITMAQCGNYQLSQLFPMLKDLIYKHGTKVHTLYFRYFIINSATIELINSLGVYRLTFDDCHFENESILKEITNTSQIHIDTDSTTCKVEMFQMFMEKWIYGSYPKLVVLHLVISPEQGENLFNQVVKKLFKSVDNKSGQAPEKPGQSHEMEYTRCDGWKIRLIYNDDTRERFIYLFTTNR